MNEKIFKYLAPPRIETTLPDGSRKIDTPLFKSATTPDGLPVTSEYWANTLRSDGNFVYFVNGQRYDGPIVITCGPEIESEILPPWRPYDPSNGNPGGH